ncbi:MAG: uracil phosphoribosyltransferase [Polyangiaceae bacterium]
MPSAASAILACIATPRRSRLSSSITTKVSSKLQDRDVIVCDPMLATGNSAIAAIERVKKEQAWLVAFRVFADVSRGLKTFHDAHPDVPVYTAAVDDHLNDHGSRAGSW